MEINGGVESAEIVRTEVERALGPSATIRKIDDFAVIELRDLDPLATADEVREALSKEVETDSVGSKVVSLHAVFDGAPDCVGPPAGIESKASLP